ncbi:MAG: ATP-binding protein [Actinobacteria bacterium]|nr:ATP-binding protein [Actinomycetota bacterium]
MNFSFVISLSVLNHLGRNLYRSFVTVLGEAISNSWDANAKNVYININKDENSFFVKDDGIGMTAEDFQNKFLKIGYSKRKEGKVSPPPENRPYIGRKGIGKLALLSCAEKITVISKKHDEDYIGGVIDNSSLDQAITDDVTPNEYPLGDWELATFSQYTKNHDQGTIVYFENIKDGIKHNLKFLKYVIALYFRFSLLDPDFKIFIDDEEITIDCLKDLILKTEFLWKINNLRDPYIEKLQEIFTSDRNEEKQLSIEEINIKGFIASVEKPRDLKITTTDERVGVDLFVNGRLRERNILKYIPTARVVENYLYGQIHFNDLDDEKDRFTSSRESIVADDPKYKKLLESLRDKIINTILKDWDVWRIKHRKDGDPENTSISTKERKAKELYNAISEEYTLPKDSENRKKVNDWVTDLGEDAKFNIPSYAECFISENLIRKYIQDKKVPLSKEAKIEISKWQKKEMDNKSMGNISIEIRKQYSDLSYMTMDDLANLIDKKDPLKEACLARDAKEYKPIRDGLAHTALLTDSAKQKLTAVYENIKGRIKTLLSNKDK